MAEGHHGRCLCGGIGYRTGADPLWVTVCYCSFCQRATGSDKMIEPIFERAGFVFEGTPSVFTLPSEGSGKSVHVHFCATCGTKLALTFERWPDKIGLYVGTLDDPAAIAVTPENSKHIFLSEARPGTIVPPGVPAFQRHAAEPDGTPVTPSIHEGFHVVGRDIP
ncbi:GFA family protein [Roseibacterium sp. SDUM158017]|uniref:GFA family protein n=1 Tax=Roseicyclus salinarum TaxID=3036773 RepID=UPI0024151B9C|nr:GFA family protein [Roseibacterium sp. SDUM158017]MDG4649821.1 GFA family protein [Roseibacterium sp. SDUM158017]